jgi:hypothetical protein
MKIKGESIEELLDFSNYHPQEAEEVKQNMDMSKSIYIAAKSLRE